MCTVETVSSLPAYEYSIWSFSTCRWQSRSVNTVSCLHQWHGYYCNTCSMHSDSGPWFAVLIIFKDKVENASCFSKMAWVVMAYSKSALITILVGYIICLAVHLVGFSTPHWTANSLSHAGLWQQCFLTEGCISLVNLHISLPGESNETMYPCIVHCFS